MRLLVSFGTWMQYVGETVKVGSYKCINFVWKHEIFIFHFRFAYVICRNFTFVHGV